MVDLEGQVQEERRCWVVRLNETQGLVVIDQRAVCTILICCGVISFVQVNEIIVATSDSVLVEMVLGAIQIPEAGIKTSAGRQEVRA